LTLEDGTDKLSRNVRKIYRCMLCNILKEDRSHPLCGRSLISHILYICFHNIQWSGLMKYVWLQTKDVTSTLKFELWYLTWGRRSWRLRCPLRSVPAGVWGTETDEGGGLFGGRELPVVSCWQSLWPSSDMAFRLHPLPLQLLKAAGTPILPPEASSDEGVNAGWYTLNNVTVHIT